MSPSAFARSLALTALAAILVAGPGRALTPMNDEELDGVRGGYVTAQGVTFGFGAVETTYVGGQLALLTTITLTSNGLVTTRTPGPSTTAGALDAAVARQLGIPAGNGIELTTPGGSAIVVNTVNANQIVNLVINSASNQAIRQNTAVTLTLPGFAQLQQTTAMSQSTAGLVNALNAGSLLTLSR